MLTFACLPVSMVSFFANAMSQNTFGMWTAISATVIYKVVKTIKKYNKHPV